MLKFDILLGKVALKVARLKGEGSALPGLLVEKVDPNFLAKTLSQLKRGVVVVTGTNGKTTTTKMIAEMLTRQGLKVFSNTTGSNLPRGLASEVIQRIPLSGRFDYDIAVLEVDEAYAGKLAKLVPVSYAVILNAEEDQLDRFGKLDHIADLLAEVAVNSQKGVILNYDDKRVAKMTGRNPKFFGGARSLGRAAVTLLSFKDGVAKFVTARKIFGVQLRVKGKYNALNAAAALVTVREILPEVEDEDWMRSISKVESEFGRGGKLVLAGKEVEIFLVKNPESFRQSLADFAGKDYEYMVAVNNKIADGVDSSWLAGVDFSALPAVRVVSGMCAKEVAAKLKRDGVEVDSVEEDIVAALRKFLAGEGVRKRIFANYTAMMAIRKEILGKSL